MKRKLRIPPLLLGADLIFMGIAEIIMSRWTKPAGTTMRLLGIACACLRLAALWDGCRDGLTPRKKWEESAQPRQAILTDAGGKRRSNVERKTLREQLTLLAESGHLWGWNAVGDIFGEGKAAERNLPYVIERCEKTAGYGMTAMPAASWGACIFTVGTRLWTIRGRFNGWRGMGNRNTPGIICRGSAICWDTTASRTRSGEKHTWRKPRIRLIKTIVWEGCTPRVWASGRILSRVWTI